LSPISVDLSSIAINYDGEISSLSNAISTISQDYLKNSDKVEIFSKISDDISAALK